MSALLGTPVIVSAAVRDGKMYLTDGRLIIGTRPAGEIEFAGEEARHTVRAGLADVLQWLGEEVGPAPVRSGRGSRILSMLRAEATK